MRVGVIMNPIAGGGALKRRWPDVGAALRDAFGDFELRETQASGDGVTLAMDLVANGVELVIAAGGDGTVGEVADGLINVAAEGGRASLGVLPCGTGADFAHGLGLPAVDEAAIRRIAGSKGRAIDAGRVCYIDEDGKLASRHFVNIASLGLSGAVAQAVNADRRKGRVSSTALYFWRTVAEFIRYRFQTVRITIDNGEPIEAKVALVVAANGRFFGGGMMVAPDAELDDGQFDIVIVRAAGKLGLLKDIQLLYGGRHRNHPAISILRGGELTVEPLGGRAGDRMIVEADGEPLGRIPATFDILSGAIMLRD